MTCLPVLLGLAYSHSHLVVCRPWSKWKRRFAGLFSTPRLRAPALTVTVHEWKPSEESSEEAWVKPLLSEQPSSPADRSTPSSGSYRSAPFASATVGKQRPKLRDRNLPADCSLLGEIGSREYGDPLSIDFHVASDFDALHKGWIVPTVPKDVDRFTVIQPEWRRHESPSPSGHGQRRLHAVEVACYNVQLELPEISPQQKTSMVEFRASMHHLFKRQQVVLGTAKVFAEGQLTSDVTPVPFGSVSTVDAAMGGATGGPATFGIRVGHVGDNDKLLLGSKDNELVLEILATGEVPSSTSSSEVTDESDDEHSFQKMQVTIVLEDGRLLHNVGRTIIHSETIDVAIGSTPDHEAETEAHITFPVPRSIIVDRKMHWRFLPGRYILRVFVKRADGGDGEWHAVDRVVELAQPADTVHFLEGKAEKCGSGMCFYSRDAQNILTRQSAVE